MSYPAAMSTDRCPRCGGTLPPGATEHESCRDKRTGRRHVSCRMHEDTVAQLEALASSWGVTRNRLIELACERLLDSPINPTEDQ